MKKIITLLFFVICTTTVFAVNFGSINGEFVMNSGFVHTFWADPDNKYTYTDVGIAPNTTVDLYITESFGDNNVTWSIPTNSTTYLKNMVVSPDGKHIRFTTSNSTGSVQLVVEDGSGTPLTIVIYVVQGGLQ